MLTLLVFAKMAAAIDSGGHYGRAGPFLIASLTKGTLLIGFVGWKLHTAKVKNAAARTLRTPVRWNPVQLAQLTIRERVGETRVAGKNAELD